MTPWGDAVEAALSKLGVTKERVAAWVGGPCGGCESRQAKLNALSDWAYGVLGVSRPAVVAGAAEQAPPPATAFTPGRRHLLYHVLPVSGNGIWRLNLDQLKWRWPLFDGRKVIAICTGEARDANGGSSGIDPPEMVREYLDGFGCEFVEVPNDPGLREVATWLPLWERLADLASTSDVVFYAHAKGVTRPVNPGTTVHTWARLMYSGNLDFWPEVESSLSRYPLTGMFKKVGRGFKGSASAWHYSGSFFWARLGEVFAADRVRRIDRLWWGNEAWPGLHFRPEDGGCLVHAGRVPTLDLYHFAYMRDWALPDVRRWAATARRTPCST